MTNSDSLKRTMDILHDTLYVHVNDNIDVVTKIDSMYNNAWNRLIFTITILAIVIPSFIAWVLQRKLKDSDKEFKKEIELLRKGGARSNGFIAQIQAESSWRMFKNNKQAISDYLKAIKYYIDAQADSNISRCLDALRTCISELPVFERKEMSLRTDIRTDLDVINAGVSNNLRPDFERMRTLLDPTL